MCFSNNILHLTYIVNMLYKFTIIISFLTCIGLILHSYDSRKSTKKKKTNIN